MKKALWVTLYATMALTLVGAVVTGCSSKQQAETKSSSDQQTAQSSTPAEKQTVYGRAVDRAKEAAQLLSNPKEGIDPVCGMALPEDPVTVMVGDKTYGFCSEHCAQQFEADPDKYLNVASADGE
jgi:YHS domain-containing protein